MELHDVIAIQVLAKQDAAFWVIRDWDGLRPIQNACEARNKFLRFGVPYASGATNDADRMRASRSLASLCASGKVKASRDKHARTQFLKLTDAGEWYYRQILDLPGLAETLAAVKRLAEMTKGPEASLGASGSEPNWVPEYALADTQWGADDASEKLWWLQVELQAARSRLWVKANSDSQRRVWYYLLPDGLAAIENPPESVDLPEPDKTEESRDFYFETFGNEREQFKDRRPADTNNLHLIPLCASIPQRKHAAALEEMRRKDIKRLGFDPDKHKRKPKQ